LYGLKTVHMTSDSPNVSVESVVEDFLAYSFVHDWGFSAPFFVGRRHSVRPLFWDHETCVVTLGRVVDVTISNSDSEFVAVGAEVKAWENVDPSCQAFFHAVLLANDNLSSGVNRPLIEFMLRGGKISAQVFSFSENFLYRYREGLPLQPNSARAFILPEYDLFGDEKSHALNLIGAMSHLAKKCTGDLLAMPSFKKLMLQEK